MTRVEIAQQLSPGEAAARFIKIVDILERAEVGGGIEIDMATEEEQLTGSEYMRGKIAGLHASRCELRTWLRICTPEFDEEGENYEW